MCVCVYVCVCVFAFKVIVWCGGCGDVSVLWWPRMRGVVVGAHGEGGRRNIIPDSGGVRRFLCKACRIGERRVVVDGRRDKSGGSVGLLSP